MKTITKITLAALVLTAVITSCKKDKKTTPVGALGTSYPNVLNTIVTPAIIDSFKVHGMVINPGLTPPTVNGIYFFSPDYCTFDNSGSDQAGDTFSDELVRFSNQNNTLYSISYAYNQGNGSEVGIDNSATYLSGSGNFFTIYAQARDTTSGIATIDLRLVSGELGNGGIKNMQEGLFLVSKGPDPGGIIVPVGTTRIFKDNDGFSETQTSFSLNAFQLNKLNRARNSVLSTASTAKAKVK